MIKTIFHPSDFSETSQIAFAHSLKLALAFQAELRLLHVSAESHHGRGYDFPSLREILANWKMLPKESHRRSVEQLGIEVDKVVVHSSNVVTAVTNFIAKHPASLIVLAAHRTENQQSWFGHSRAEPIARNAATATLFISDDVKGFVSLDDGSVSLKKVLMPIALEPSPQSAIRFVESIGKTLHCEDFRIHGLHVGNAGTLPSLPHDPESRFEIDIQSNDSNIVDAILERSDEIAADLIVMPTRGHHGFLDLLRGSTTEQVLRHAKCPVLAITSY
jgi:nucleotide-binding universal stress UspA family protein